MFQNMQSEFSLWLEIWIENSLDPCNLVGRRILHWQWLKNSWISDALWKLGTVDLTYIVLFENVANVFVIRTMWCSRYKWFFLTYYRNTMQQNLRLSIPCFHGSEFNNRLQMTSKCGKNKRVTDNWGTAKYFTGQVFIPNLMSAEIFIVQTHSNMESVWLPFMIKMLKAVNGDIIYSWTCWLKAYYILIFTYFVPSHTGSVVGRCFQWWRIHVSQFWCLIWRNVG